MDPTPTEPFKTPTQVTVSEGTELVRSRISEVMVKLERNYVFNAMVAGRRWALAEFQGAPFVCVSLGEGKTAGEVVDYRIIAEIFDANGECVRGVTVVLNTDLEIIDVFDWPIVERESAKPALRCE